MKRLKGLKGLKRLKDWIVEPTVAIDNRALILGPLTAARMLV
jgi:hypothetical protein